MTDISVTPTGHRDQFRITGAPNLPNRHGAGRIRPDDVTLTYRYSDGRILALVYGRWVRDDDTLTDAPIGQEYHAPAGDTAGWPDWLAVLAREHAPAAAPRAR